MTRRSYSQYCGVARALNIIGDRWTVIIVRDLLVGPMRYKDLLEGLQGIGTNLLATRLRELEEAGVVERAVLPPPAGSAVYQLTEDGLALEPVIFAIGRWGSRFLGQPGETDVLVPRAYFIAMRSRFRPEVARDLRTSYELHVDGHIYEVRVEAGKCTTREGSALDPDTVMALDVETLNALMLDGLSPQTAIGEGRLSISRGDAASVERFVAIFAIRQANDAAASSNAR